MISKKLLSIDAHSIANRYNTMYFTLNDPWEYHLERIRVYSIEARSMERRVHQNSVLCALQLLENILLQVPSLMLCHKETQAFGDAHNIRVYYTYTHLKHAVNALNWSLGAKFSYYNTNTYYQLPDPRKRYMPATVLQMNF